MISGDTWTERVELEGFASAVVMVTAMSDCPAKRFELRLECIGLGTHNTPIPVTVYIWDERPANEAREYYRSKFEVGSFWRISGRIDYEETIVFSDPVYMSYSGRACEILSDALN